MWNSPWISGNSKTIPIYSGEDGCLRHWISWNRGESYVAGYQLLLPSPSVLQGDDAVDITPEQE